MVPNSIVVNQKKIKINNEKNYLLYMGRIAKNKNINFMIDIINLLNKQFTKKFNFLIIGPDYGERENLILKINSLNLQKQIKIFKPIYSADRLSYIKNCKALLLASDYECNSMVVAEALSLGVLVISSKECNTEEIAKYGACITIDKNEEVFVKNIKKVFSNDRYKKIQKKAKQFSKEFLDLDKNTEKLNNFYLSL